MTASDASALIVGIGNPLRGDDGAGPAVLRRLAQRFAKQDLPADIDILQHHGEGTALLEAWQDYRRVILIDAMRAAAPAGEVHRFDVLDRPLPAETFYCSSHRFGPAEAIELGRVLGRLPASLVVYGIVGNGFGYSDCLTPSVAAAVERVAELICAELTAC